MKRQLLLFIHLLPALLFAQQEVIFPDDFKTNALDGKEVTITNTLTLTNNYSYAYGSITLSDGPLWTPTEKNLPGIEMFNQKNKENQDNQITVKQGAYSFTDANGTCRIGQTVAKLTGTASYSNGKYTITLTKKPEFQGNERPITCEIEEDYNLKVVSFNVENYKGTNDVQRTKIVAALKAMDADIYALLEVFGNSSLNDLCTALNTACQTDQYKYIENSTANQGMACFIYNSNTVTPFRDLQKNKLADNGYLPDRKIAQAFDLKANNERFIVCLNHWKAKDNSYNKPDEYADTGDGQGSHVLRRVHEAEATLEFIKTVTAYFEDEDVLIVGDLNSYSKEDPIRVLEEGELINELQKYAPNEYSYAFFSNNSYATGYLDHSFATATLDAQIRYAHPFHINADEPDALKIGGKPQEDTMYRCSDHNPIVTFIKLGTTTGIESPSSSYPTIQLIGDPRNGYLTLVSNTDLALTRAEIVNINGKIIAAYDPNNAGNTEKHFTLPVKNLACGFYLLRVYDTQGKCTTCKVVLP